MGVGDRVSEGRVSTESTELQRAIEDLWNAEIEPNVQRLSPEQLAKMLETLKREWQRRARER